MNITVRLGAVVMLLSLLAACGSSGPASPTGTTQPPTVPSPTPPVTDFPPLAGPSRTFVFDHERSYPVSDYTKHSRFVLYDNGAVALQYPSLSSGEGYRGAYKDANGVIAFEWQGGNAWTATGILKADSLTVQYGIYMALSDFEDAVYVLMP